MNFPKELKYTKDHEWAKLEGKILTVGITEHAGQALGDVVFVDLPKVGRKLNKGETFGVVESIKAVSDLYSPLAGTITEVNPALSGEPSTVNKDPYKAGWMIKIELQDPSIVNELLTPEAYEAHVKSL